MRFTVWYTDTMVKSTRRARNMRIGQVYFNELYRVHPKLADRIRGTEFDPYYVPDSEHFRGSSRIKRFFEYVEENW